jgi:hypothetical protein
MGGKLTCFESQESPKGTLLQLAPTRLSESRRGLSQPPRPTGHSV